MIYPIVQIFPIISVKDSNKSLLSTKFIVLGNTNDYKDMYIPENRMILIPYDIYIRVLNLNITSYETKVVYVDHDSIINLN